MSDQPFTGTDFTLDTSSMGEIAAKCDRIAERMRTMKQDLDNANVILLDDWRGEGSKTYQKKYHFLIQQLKDLSQNLHDLAEEIRCALDIYIQADMDLAKSMDGVTKPE